MKHTTKFDVQNLSEEDMKQLQKQAARNLTKMITIKLGIYLGIAVAAHVLTKKLDAANVVEAVADTITE